MDPPQTGAAKQGGTDSTTRLTSIAWPFHAGPNENRARYAAGSVQRDGRVRDRLRFIGRTA